jgi:hypothetical protein
MLSEKKNTLVNEKLKATIVGDSFSHYYEDTYLELLFKDLDIIDHVGFKGGSQYRIYKKFLDQLDKAPDIIICVHTEFARLYLEDFCINYSKVQNSLQKNPNQDKELYEAADGYYKYLYNNEYSQFNHNLIIKEMQRLCKAKNIKMINIPAFYNNYLTKEYGLWLSIQPEGLHTIAEKGISLNAKLKNHLTPSGHLFVAKNFLPHVIEYINNKSVTIKNVKF